MNNLNSLLHADPLHGIDIPVEPHPDPLAHGLPNLANAVSMNHIMQRAPGFLPVPTDIYRSMGVDMNNFGINTLNTNNNSTVRFQPLYNATMPIPQPVAQTVPMAGPSNPVSFGASDVTLHQDKHQQATAQPMQIPTTGIPINVNLNNVNMNMNVNVNIPDIVPNVPIFIPKKPTARPVIIKPSSRYCHVCVRPAKRFGFVRCANNIIDGSCRKVVCKRCFEDAARDYAAAKNAGNWKCWHCTQSCPMRASCTTYNKTNQKRVPRSRRRAGVISKRRVKKENKK